MPVLLSLPLHGLPSTLWYYGTLFPVCRQEAGSLIFTDSDTCPAKGTREASRGGRTQTGESQDMTPASWGHGVTDWRGRLWDTTGFINCHRRITCNLDCQKKKRMEDFTLSLKRSNSHSCHSKQNQRASLGDVLSSTYTYLRVWGCAEFSGILEGNW